MGDSESDYKVGPGRPPLHTRFKKGQSGNPGWRHPSTARRDDGRQWTDNRSRGRVRCDLHHTVLAFSRPFLLCAASPGHRRRVLVAIGHSAHRATRYTVSPPASPICSHGSAMKFPRITLPRIGYASGKTLPAAPHSRPSTPHSRSSAMSRNLPACRCSGRRSREWASSGGGTVAAVNPRRAP